MLTDNNNTNNTNKWDDDADEYNEYDEDYIQNETPPPIINKEFSDNILNVKHSLYDNIVLAPSLGTKKAQSNNILQDYLDKLNDVYVLSTNAQRGNTSNFDDTLKRFPEGSREVIQRTLNYITTYFKQNPIEDTIPYSDYIRKSFHEYQFIQDTSSFD